MRLRMGEKRGLTGNNENTSDNANAKGERDDQASATLSQAASRHHELGQRQLHQQLYHRHMKLRSLAIYLQEEGRREGGKDLAMS